MCAGFFPADGLFSLSALWTQIYNKSGIPYVFAEILFLCFAAKRITKVLLLS